MKKFYERKKWILMVSMILLLIGTTTTVFGMSDDAFAAYMKRNGAWFTSNNWFLDGFRTIGWMLVKGLAVLCNLCQELYSYSLGLIDFTTYGALQEWITTLKGVFTVLLILSLVFCGTLLIISHEKRPKFLQAIMLAGVSISALGYIMITLNQGVSAFCREVAVGDTSTNNVINSNFFDLSYIDEKRGLASLDINNAEYLASCHYPEGALNLDLVDINAVLNYEDFDTEDTKYILGHDVTWKMNPYDGNYKYFIKDIYNGWGWNSAGDDNWFNQFYYRYHVNYINIYITLIAYCIVYICISYKTVRIIYELAITRILALLYSADINGTQKTIRILGSLKDGYIVLMLSAICIKVFNFAQLYLSDKAASNSLVYNIIFLFIAFAVIDGPVLIQQLTGIDAGLQSGIGKVMAAHHAAQAAKSMVTKPAQMLWQQHQHNQMLRRFSDQKVDSQNVAPQTASKDNADAKNGMDADISKKENTINRDGLGAFNKDVSSERNMKSADKMESNKDIKSSVASDSTINNADRASGDRDLKESNKNLDIKNNAESQRENPDNSSNQLKKNEGAENTKSGEQNINANRESGENKKRQNGKTEKKQPPVVNATKDDLKRKMSKMPGNMDAKGKTPDRGNIQRKGDIHKKSAGSAEKNGHTGKNTAFSSMEKTPLKTSVKRENSISGSGEESLVGRDEERQLYREEIPAESKKQDAIKEVERESNIKTERMNEK